MPQLNYYLLLQEVTDDEPGRGMKKADESVLAARVYVTLFCARLST